MVVGITTTELQVRASYGTLSGMTAPPTDPAEPDRPANQSTHLRDAAIALFGRNHESYGAERRGLTRLYRRHEQELADAHHRIEQASDDRARSLRDALAAGASMLQVARHLNLNYGTVRRIADDPETRKANERASKRRARQSARAASGDLSVAPTGPETAALHNDPDEF